MVNDVGRDNCGEHTSNGDATGHLAEKKRADEKKKPPKDIIRQQLGKESHQRADVMKIESVRTEIFSPIDEALGRLFD